MSKFKVGDLVTATENITGCDEDRVFVVSGTDGVIVEQYQYISRISWFIITDNALFESRWWAADSQLTAS